MHSSFWSAYYLISLLHSSYECVVINWLAQLNYKTIRPCTLYSPYYAGACNKLAGLISAT